MSLGFRLSLGPSSCSLGGGAGGAVSPVGGCFLHLHLQACFWRLSREQWRECGGKIAGAQPLEGDRPRCCTHSLRLLAL